MSLRPLDAVWFEALVPKAQCARVLGVLAGTGAVEIEVRRHNRMLDLEGLAGGLRGYRALQQRYQRYWRGRLNHQPVARPPGAILQRVLEEIERWRVEADPLIDRLQRLEAERQQLHEWLELLATPALQEGSLDFGQLCAAGPVLAPLFALVPQQPGTSLPDYPSDALLTRCGADHLLGLVSQRQRPALLNWIKSASGRLLTPPTGLQGSAALATRHLRDRLAEVNGEIVTLYALLDDLFDDGDLGPALGETTCLAWFVEQVGALEQIGNQFVWVTGWSGLLPLRRLERELQRDDAALLLHFPDPPHDLPVPQILDNPRWMRPFELFARTFGTPGHDEVDPSGLLAFIVPLLFGYMFADIGQGLLLALTGWLLRRRWANATLLLAGGLSAAFFGLLFGSLFSYEGLLPPLAFSPLHEPVLTLALPLLFGAGLLTLGQLLDGLQASWRGQGSQWLGRDAGLLVAYLGLLASPWSVAAAYMALLGVLWFAFGQGWRRLPGSVAALLEDAMRLLVNTLSFARVGAFCLAHAGLSSALMVLAEASGSLLWGALIMLLGNLLILLLEGLAVSVQTTRLVLFEFFMRFLESSGRPLRPLPPPPEVIRGRFS